MFFMFGSANRDEACFADPDRFDITRDTQKSIAFGAGPHYCAGAFASRAMVADVALPGIFARLKGLRLDDARAGADRRLGVSGPAQSAGEVGRGVALTSRAFPVAELVDDHGTGNGMECQRVHVVVVHDVLAQARIIGIQHAAGGARRDVAVAIVAGMEQQRGAALDADVAQPQKQRAVRLAMALDAKQLAAGIGAIDLRLEILDPSALAEFFGSGGKGDGRNHYKDKTNKSKKIFHGTTHFIRKENLRNAIPEQNMPNHASDGQTMTTNIFGEQSRAMHPVEIRERIAA